MLAGCWVMLSVALLAEGVDRNIWMKYYPETRTRSPSSRRAWIEIDRWLQTVPGLGKVALLAEGVDRNQPSG